MCPSGPVLSPERGKGEQRYKMTPFKITPDFLFSTYEKRIKGFVLGAELE